MRSLANFICIGDVDQHSIFFRVVSLSHLRNRERQRSDNQRQSQGRSGLQVDLHQWVSTAFTIAQQEVCPHHQIKEKV